MIVCAPEDCYQLHKNNCDCCHQKRYDLIEGLRHNNDRPIQTRAMIAYRHIYRSVLLTIVIVRARYDVTMTQIDA